MRQAWAVARLTLKEGLRARTLPVLAVLFALTLALTAAATGSAATPQERFRALLSASGQGTHLLLLLAATTLGALSYPQEARRKTLLHLFSKPLSRGAYLAGKWAGLAALLLLLGAACSAVATAFIASTGSAAPSGARAIQVPLGLLGAEAVPAGTRWRFAPSPGRAPSLLQVSLAVSPPPSLDAVLSQGGGGVTVTLPFNSSGDAESVLPPLQPGPDGGYAVVLPLSANRVLPGPEGVRLVALSPNYPGLLVQAMLGDWIQAVTLCALALAVSLFVSAPVALFTAATLTLMAHAHPLVKDLEGLIARQDRIEAAAPAAPSRHALVAREVGNLRYATPDLAALELCPALALAESRPWWDVSWTALACLPYALAGLLLAWIGLSRAELGR